MPNVMVRNIPKQTYSRLRARARSFGRSLNAEILDVLAEKDSWEKRRLEIAKVLPELRRTREEIAKEHPNAPDSVTLIREDRDSR
jgi:plasmid stability protein